jgi:crotonobetainyl-CoA:carnitine CoA-transferase CaiB-like acyl-CoA transferase
MAERSGGPLSGIRVLDLSAYIAGPYGCSLLADMGADIIKIEPPTGDTLRQYPSTLAAEGRAFLGVNRSKRGIVIDLKKPEGLAVLQRLVADADVLVHNFRPSVPGRLGIDYDALKAIKPNLIYCTLTGYGQTGPLAHKAGYDQVLQSITGICTFQGEGRDGPEIVYGSVVDFYAAALLSNAVCAALYHRQRTGQGQALGVSLLGASLAMQATRFVWADYEPRAMSRDMRSGGITGIHPCADGTAIYVSANTPHFWKALCEKIGEPEMAANPDYDTVRKRAARADEIVPRLRAALKKRTAVEWEEIFGEDVPCGAVRAIEDMFDYPQVLEQDYVAHLTHPKVGGYRTLSNAFQFGGTRQPETFSAPAQGQHTDDILRDYGYSAEDIALLRAKNAVS